MEGKNISMLMPPPYSQMHNGLLHAYNDTGTSNIINRTRELQGLHMDRYTFPIKLAVTKVAQTGKATLRMCCRRVLQPVLIMM